MSLGVIKNGHRCNYLKIVIELSLIEEVMGEEMKGRLIK